MKFNPTHGLKGLLTAALATTAAGCVMPSQNTEKRHERKQTEQREAFIDRETLQTQFAAASASGTEWELVGTRMQDHFIPGAGIPEGLGPVMILTYLGGKYVLVSEHEVNVDEYNQYARYDYNACLILQQDTDEPVTGRRPQKIDSCIKFFTSATQQNYRLLAEHEYDELNKTGANRNTVRTLLPFENLPTAQSEPEELPPTGPRKMGPDFRSFGTKKKPTYSYTHVHGIQGLANNVAEVSEGGKFSTVYIADDGEMFFIQEPNGQRFREIRSAYNEEGRNLKLGFRVISPFLKLN